MGCLSHAWRLWAAPRREALRREMAAPGGVLCYGQAVPNWFLMAAWPHLPEGLRLRAALVLARGGRLQVLQRLCEQNPRCRWDISVAAAAAGGGHLKVLQWARQHHQPCPWDMTVCVEAARGGHLEVLQWARQQEPPCPWGETVCAAAPVGGHLEVLQWLRQQQPPCPCDPVAEAAAHVNTVEELREMVLRLQNW